MWRSAPLLPVMIGFALFCLLTWRASSVIIRMITRFTLHGGIIQRGRGVLDATLSAVRRACGVTLSAPSDSDKEAIVIERPESATHQLRIKRLPQGFEVVDQRWPEKTFSYWGSTESLQRILSEIVVARVQANPSINLDQLVDVLESDTQSLERFNLSDVPWAGLHLQMQWMIGRPQKRGHNILGDQACRRTAQLLEEWYERLQEARKDMFAADIA